MKNTLESWSSFSNILSFQLNSLNQRKWYQKVCYIIKNLISNNWFQTLSSISIHINKYIYYPAAIIFRFVNAHNKRCQLIWQLFNFQSVCQCLITLSYKREWTCSTQYSLPKEKENYYQDCDTLLLVVLCYSVIIET